jgi:transcriptional regulator with XRE-family HTH domain
MRPSRNLPLIHAFSAVLKARRLELGLTQEDLAGLVDLDRPYITMLEAGRKQPTLSVLWRIAAGLELSAGELAARVDKQLVLASRLRPAS